jgi:hypothetical protein
MANVLTVPFERHVIQGMTHMLRAEEGEPSVSKYKEELKKPIEHELLDVILRWLNERIGGMQVKERSHEDAG